ncbi:hypothetical protein E8E13_006636 [Curvularia kusanoi]|uniref:Uncharacterized protein n=1 Tax=Curvularia kusanoi TaxID=90978 RepID=A0A9P4W8L6_CURKU|nr:hypothetical protein E8E13_006636 [Curvularia kusanoi]
MTKDTMSTESFKLARALKAEVLQNVAILQPADASPSEPGPTFTAADKLITELRSEDLSWGDITAQLNSDCVSAGEAPTWTEAAAYSRFILQSSTTHTPVREIGFEPRDYAHLKNAGSKPETDHRLGKKRVKDFQNATELSANVRTPAIIVGVGGVSTVVRAKQNKKGKGKAKTAVKEEVRRNGGAEASTIKVDDVLAETLMRAVAKVERNFWVFVADEVEREAGAYVEPKDLERIFHEI